MHSGLVCRKGLQPRLLLVPSQMGAARAVPFFSHLGFSELGGHRTRPKSRSQREVSATEPAVRECPVTAKCPAGAGEPCDGYGRRTVALAKRWGSLADSFGVKHTLTHVGLCNSPHLTFRSSLNLCKVPIPSKVNRQELLLQSCFGD